MTETVRIDGEEYVLAPDDTPSVVDTTAGDLSEDETDEPVSPAPAATVTVVR